MKSAGDRTPPSTTPVLTFLLLHCCYKKMNIGSSVLHIVVEPATVCCRNVGVVDTIQQLLMIHIVERSCQIERNECCSMSQLFSLEAGSFVGGDR